ncbi:MAG: oligosaccharide flippase family protein [Povalibacter sp.]
MSAQPEALVAPAFAGAESPAVKLSTRELDRRATSSLMWQGAKVAVHLVQYVVLARLVVPAEFGKFALVAPLFLVLSCLNDGGLSTATVTGRRYDALLASTLWFTQVGMGCVMALLMIAGSPVFAAMFGVPDLSLIGAALAISLIVESCGLQSRAHLRRDMRVGAVAVVEIGGLILGIVAAFIAARWTQGAMLVVIAQICNALGRSSIAYALAPMRLQGFSATAEYRDALRTGWHVVGSDLLIIMRTQFPSWVLGFFLVLSQVGLFSRANQLVNVPLTMLAPAMGNFLLPLLCRARDRWAEFQAHIQRTQRMFIAISMPLSIWIAMGPAHLIEFALGSEWTPAVPILQALSPLFISQVISTVARMSLLASEQSQVDRQFSFVSLVLTILAVLIAAPFGVLAVSLALSLSAVALRTPVIAIMAVRKGNMGASNVVDGLRTVAVLALISATFLLLVRSLPLNGLATDLLGLLIMGGVSALALILILRRPHSSVCA